MLCYFNFILIICSVIKQISNQIILFNTTKPKIKLNIKPS
nr:MAG TPA: hypothetical protein [Caudoviricetes sp.]